MASQSGTRRQRVPALAPDERRAALIAATIPLLREHGTNVSTRQIAEAAGVAEGTIFGVFKDKSSLLRAAVLAALDPAPLLRDLKSIDPALPLRQRLAAAARLVRAHVAGQGALFILVRGPLFAGDRRSLGELMAGRYLILNELTSLIEPDARLLRRSPAIAARLLLSLVGSPQGAFAVLDEHLTDDEVVSIILDGLLIRPHTDEVLTEDDIVSTVLDPLPEHPPATDRPT
ncbi:MAG: TetR/AcrR family transcriptional regulator [Micromonosporaceae bacterium]|nr:TetR/AcrR family transcriptional regulator [Micromonosporaceae bacterium]